MGGRPRGKIEYGDWESAIRSDWESRVYKKAWGTPVQDAILEIVKEHVRKTRLPIHASELKKQLEGQSGWKDWRHRTVSWMAAHGKLKRLKRGYYIPGPNA